jgi:hypothetical protein
MNEQSESLVFTDEFGKRIEGKIKRKYPGKDSVEWPEIYRIAVLDEYSRQRSQIEEWVALLPEGKQSQIIGRLRKDDLRFRDAFNELLVGDMLRQLGHKIEYERAIPGVKKTPDWYVSFREDMSTFYVEVLTADAPEQRIDDERRWDSLCRRIEKLAPGFGLSLSADPRCDAPESENKAKKIAEKVGIWLKDIDPAVGEGLILDNSTLEELTDEYANWGSRIVIGVCERGDASQKFTWCVVSPGEAYLIDEEPLRKKIRPKAKKYARSLADKGIPFVICIVPTPESLFGHRSIEDALFGQSAIRYVKGRGRENIRLLDGLWREEVFNGVSAIWWAQTEWRKTSFGEQGVPMRLFLNPFALKNPLPPGAFGLEELEGL